ncbi:MAG TPA: hypothetical protein VFS82_07060 [Lysobacter sp.]|nr:hypothetical protein [Lysobacter sp.]
MDSAQYQSLPRFRRYSNKRGHSAVTEYAALAKSIAVKFADGAIYLYDMDCPGPQHVERMKELAQAGEGLYSYISRRVGRRYASQLDEPPRASRHEPYSTRQNTAFR